MKNLTNLIAALLTLQTSLSTDTQAQDYVVALSPNVNKTLAQEFYLVATRVIEKAPPETKLRFISGGTSPSVITELTKQTFPNQRVEQRHNAIHQAKIAQFLKNAVTKQAPSSELATLDLPMIIQALTGHIKGPTRLALLGSPIWMSAQEHSFINPNESNPNRRFRAPSVGHLNSDLLLTPFGVPSNAGTLAELKVIWWNPVAKQSGPLSYRKLIESWWVRYLSGLEIAMTSIQEDKLPFLQNFYSTSLIELTPSYEKGGSEVTIVTLEELIKDAQEQALHTSRILVRKQLQAFSIIWLVDCSGSQASALETIARRISEERGISNQYMGLILFDSGKAALYSESANALEIASAFRQAPSLGGMDLRGSFGAGLKISQELITQRQSRHVTLRIVSDVAPALEENRPIALQYPTLLEQLINSGHRIEFVRCDKSLDTSTFLPAGTQVSDLLK